MAAYLKIPIPEWLDRFCTWPVLLYRRHKYGYPFRKISLGDGRYTILDQQDYYRFCSSSWCVAGHSNRFYAVRTIVLPDGNTKTLRLHREITNAPKGTIVDHRNTISLDNRRDNLRFATHTQNMHNRKKRKGCTSKYIGVWRNKEKSKWETRIKHRGSKIFLGRFENEIDAAKAYDAAALKYRGEFARLNFP